MPEPQSDPSFIFDSELKETHGIVVSLYGYDFDPSSDIWLIRPNCRLYISGLRPLFSPELWGGLLKTLTNLARTRSFATCQQACRDLADYAKSMSPDKALQSWEVKDLHQYRKKLLSRFGHETYLIHVRSFLKSWYKLRHPGVSSEVFEELKAMTLEGSPAGRNARKMDQEKGPLNTTEVRKLTTDLHLAFENGNITLEQYSLAILQITIARRPIQNAYIKCKDLQQSSTDSQNQILNEASRENKYYLNIPRIKQRGNTFRDEFRAVQLTPELYTLFDLQKKSVSNKLREVLTQNSWTISESDQAYIEAEAPLFPAWTYVKESIGKISASLDSTSPEDALLLLKELATNSKWHKVSTQMGLTLDTTFRRVTNLSGNPTKIGATRLRHTKGTSLAKEGLSPEIIGWLLDHTRLESVKIYVDNLPEQAIPANAAMARSPLMKNIAKLFQGRLVDKETDANGGDHPELSRIYFKGDGSATCGTRKNCGMGTRIPLCCYECSSFQPWLDGPHLKVLEMLLKERSEREQALGTDHKITKAADSTIIAVINVIQCCDARKTELRNQEIGGAKR